MAEIKNFTFEITSTALCDLKCTYCFEGKKTNTQTLNDKSKLIVQRIKELKQTQWFKDNFNNLSLSFWGGEPSLNPDFIIDIIRQCQHDEMIKFHIYSNGYNLENLLRIVDSLEDKNKLHIQISHDGKIIHDKFRLNHNNESTGDIVYNNFKELAKKDIDLSLKSTLTLESLEYINSAWDDFEKLYHESKEISEKVYVSYAPTIDYVNCINQIDRDKELEVFRRQMLKVAKKEINFFIKNNRHLCSWFGGEKNHKNCSSGYNMVALDVDGSFYVCHGGLYSSFKKHLTMGTLFDDNIAEKIAEFNESFKSPISHISDECKDCVATACMICPVNSYEYSKKENFFDRWLDYGINNLCSFYRTSGEIDRAIQSYLTKEKYNGVHTNTL